MNLTIIQAEMRRTDDGYVGTVQFSVEGHRHAYEAALHSRDGKDWSYGLFFLNESGSEEDIDEVDAWLDENDDAFALLVETARRTLDEL